MSTYLPTIKQLQYLVALHEHGHFGRAAEASFVSQSTLSAGIRELESPLSGELRMSVIPTIAPFMLPRMLPRLRRERPALKLFLREETTTDALESLHHGRADCVLMALPFATGEF